MAAPLTTGSPPPATASPIAAPTVIPDVAPGLLARALMRVIGVYRSAISPIRPRACRYTPTCSGYAVDAIAIHGAGRGMWLAVRRVLRCHPFRPGGHDPVPPRVSSSDTDSAVSSTTPPVTAA